VIKTFGRSLAAVPADEERIRSLPHKRGKAVSISRMLLALNTWISSPSGVGRIDQHGDPDRLGHQLMEEFQLLGQDLLAQDIDPGRVAAPVLSYDGG
jgi:hypothetical protein